MILFMNKNGVKFYRAVKQAKKKSQHKIKRKKMMKHLRSLASTMP